LWATGPKKVRCDDSQANQYYPKLGHKSLSLPFGKMIIGCEQRCSTFGDIGEGEYALRLSTCHKI